MMTTYVRNGILIVEIIDGRTVDIMKREKSNKTKGTYNNNFSS